MGSIKLACTLPKGIYHEAHIRKQNGRWYLCLKLWQEPNPTSAPAPEHPGRHGAVDTGINPIATDSDGQAYQNSKAYYAMERKLKRWQRPQARWSTSSRGWREAQRRIDRCHRRIRGIRHNASHQMTNTLTRKYNVLVIDGPERGTHDGGAHTQGPGRRQHGRNTSPAGIQGTMATGATHTGPPPIPPAASCAVHASATTRNSRGKDTGSAQPAELDTNETSTQPQT